MISGAGIRRYRKAIRMGQIAFAETMGVSQSTLSALETGRIAISADHIESLKQHFDAPGFAPTFTEFLGLIQREQAGSQAALSAPENRFLTLTLWRWEDGLDLSQRPAPDRARGLVTVRAIDNPAIAFEMNRRTERWEKGEILVFEGCEPQELEDGELCLVQVKRPRAKGSQTMIASVLVSRPSQQRRCRFEPISPSSQPFSDDEVTIVAVLHLLFRGMYLH